VNNQVFSVSNPAPICIGTGLLALDVVFNGNPNVKPNYWAGGSCGNVLTVLSYLGWQSFPVARLGKDPAAIKLTDDLHRFKVRLDYVHNDKNVNTPVIVERIRNIGGIPTHKFYWVCPNCGTWLPRYRAILQGAARNIMNKMPIPQCFYFDRVSPGALELAKSARKAGSLVIFEPPSVKDDKNYITAIQLSHIVKYAHDRYCNIDRLKVSIYPFLLIETLGAEGLRYQFRRNARASKAWKTIPAYHVDDLRDAAGAGDWCTAGIIHMLGGNGNNDVTQITEEMVIEALRFGQAMAAFNCRFEGARGGMYKVDKRTFEKAIKNIIKNQSAYSPIDEPVSNEARNLLRRICPGCKGHEKLNKRKTQKIRIKSFPNTYFT